MYILYPIGLVLTYFLLRYFCKCDRVYRGVFAEKREKQWDEIIVFLIYFALMIIVFWQINPHIGFFGRLPNKEPNQLDLIGVASLYSIISTSFGAFIGTMRSYTRCVNCNAISKEVLLRTVEECLRRLDKQPYIKHGWGRSIYRITGGVVDVRKFIILQVECSRILVINRPELRDELVARIQEAAEVEQGCVESKPGAILWVNRAAIILLLSLWVIWIGWFTY